MAIVEPPDYQVRVSLAHVMPCVIVRPAKGHRQKGFLLADLLVHINTFEEAADAVIA